jgi:hypothetical protein
LTDFLTEQVLIVASNLAWPANQGLPKIGGYRGSKALPDRMKTQIVFKKLLPICIDSILLLTFFT